MSLTTLRVFRWLLIPVLVGVAQASDSDYTPTWLISLFVFSVALLTYGELSVLIEHRERMPYRWQCPRCKRKTGMEASDKAMIESFRVSHNRTVHLQEP